jgi:hypothetical protein
MAGEATSQGEGSQAKVKTREEILAELKARLAALNGEIDQREVEVGGTWDPYKNKLTPSEDTLRVFAWERRVPLMAPASLVVLRIVYYALMIGLAVTYGFLIAELANVEGFLLWALRAGIALAFLGAGLFVKQKWTRFAIIRSVEPLAVVRLQQNQSIGLTILILAIDLVLSFYLIRSAAVVATLGALNMPLLIVWMMALLTGIAQLIGAFLGFENGKRDAVISAWLSTVKETKGVELDALIRAVEERRRVQEQMKVS